VGTSIAIQKDKDNSDELARIEYLRRRNQDLRTSHEKELQDIQKAIYLVKLDDAREVKNISEKHSQRLKEMEFMHLSQQRDKKRRVAEESMAAKERYVKYWKEKLANIYTEQAQTIVNVGKQKEDKKRELQSLEEEEIKLMEEINKYHSQGV
jgi:cell division protein FtsB